MAAVPRVAIVYLMYHSDVFVGRFIDALAHAAYPTDRLHVLAVDHPHPDHGSSVPALEAALLGYADSSVIPAFEIFVQKENKGFSGGVNVAIAAALEQGFDYVFLHSHDGFLAPDALARLVAALENDRTIGAAQSLMLSYPETSKVNNEGGVFHYLGFGHIGGAGKKIEDIRPGIRDIGYASGGAVMLRADLLRQYGLWDEDYFLYHEDIEYSLRLRSVGYRIAVVTDAVLYHEYEFGRNPKKWYFMERNRWGLLLTYYKIWTLLLLVPVAIVTELAIFFFALINGWLPEKMRATWYWLNPLHYPSWLAKRKKTQLQRVMRDRDLFAFAESSLTFGEGQEFSSSFIVRAGNPVARVLFLMFKKIIFW